MELAEQFIKLLKHWLLIFLPLTVLQLCPTALAQQVVKLDDQISNSMLGRNLELLEDREKRFTIEEIVAGSYDRAFIGSRQKVPNYSYTRSAYWARLIIDGSATKRDDWLIEIENPLLNNIDIWVYDIRESGNQRLISEAKFGNSLPFNQRKLLSRSFVLPLHLTEKNKQLLYFRFQSSDNIILPISLWQSPDFYQQDHGLQIFYGIYYGILLITLLYNLIIYFGVRQQSYLYYVFFVVLYGLLNASFTGYSFEYFWPAQPWLAMHAVGILIYPTLFFATLFQKTFLDLKHNFPWANRFLNGFLIFIATCYPLVFINYRISIVVIMCCCALYSLTALFFGTICWYRGSRAARFFVIAWLILIAAVMAIALRSFGIIGDSFFILHSPEIGSIAEMVLLSVGLADRLNSMRKEKEQAQAEALHQQQMRTEEVENRNLLLESMVTDRTRKLAETVDQLAEAKQIAERHNQELDQKVHELNKANADLIASQKQADRIFMALAEALPGTVIDGKYQLGEKIGAGGFGAVFRAIQLGVQRPVAVKIFRPTPGNDSAEAVERFRFEGISAARVNHPNAVQVIDSGISTEGFAYLVMELLAGDTLLDLMKRGALFTIARCAEILIPVCQALATAHENSIVHRDIKPENIFLHHVESREIVKVVDFGVATIMSDNLEKEINHLTATGILIGTPAYIAPERISGQPYDGRADVYSIGIILYEMFLARAPFAEKDYISMLMAHVHKEPPRPSEVMADLPEKVDKVMLAALAKDYLARPTAQQLAVLLAELAQEYPDLSIDREKSITAARISGYDQEIIYLETLKLNTEAASQVTTEEHTLPQWQSEKK